MQTYRIVLADDHAMFRQGIKRILDEIDGLAVVGEAGDGLTLLKLLRKVPADMVILDISMPGMRGIEATREITAAHPGVKVLMLTMHRDLEYFYHAISAGAQGFLLKEDADVQLVTAIATIREGQVYLSPLITQELTGQVFRGEAPGESGVVEVLTTREREVLKLIAEGKTSREVANLFCISVRTVQHHRANMMRKLDIKKTADLVKYAIRRGYTSLNSGA
jgi:DNA-binding NarL/FixJ family response regulator